MSKFKELINSTTPTLVDFYADWCGPCKMMAPILKELKNEMGDKLTIIKVDVDKNQKASQAYNVQSIPTLILFKNGAQVWRQAGAMSKEQLRSKVETLAN